MATAQAPRMTKLIFKHVTRNDGNFNNGYLWRNKQKLSPQWESRNPLAPDALMLKALERCLDS